MDRVQKGERKLHEPVQNTMDRAEPTFTGWPHFGPRSFFGNKKGVAPRGCNALQSFPIFLVAGAGFEPTTFGL
jgi:hypothetical protein